MSTVVYHTGALGDSVLIWPLLRTLAHRGERVRFVTDSEKASLAAAEIGREPGLTGRIEPASAESPPHTLLWRGEPLPPDPRTAEVRRVLTFVADPATEAGDRWHAAARTLYPHAKIEAIGPHASPSLLALWQRERVAECAGVPLRPNIDGPVVMHIGAGSEAKRWPLDRFATLRTLLADRGIGPIDTIAGEVEAERLPPADRSLFAAMGGRFTRTLAELADTLRAARLVLGCDSGPSHLAAQLGVPTVAVFGPTDPRVWAPVGPRVRAVVGHQTNGYSDWVDASVVLGTVRQLGIE